jgi:DNA-binding transcriptional LysR family regulator
MDRLAAMQAFVKVIEAGSFSAAARQLRVGQPAVSKTVAQLEEHLGLPLLLRSSRRLQRHRGGPAVLRACQAGDRPGGRGGSGRARRGRGPDGAAAGERGRHPRPPRDRAEAGQHPRLEIELILDDRNVDLVGEGIDVALRMGALTDSALSARKIAATPRRVMGRGLFRAGRPAADARRAIVP